MVQSRYHFSVKNKILDWKNHAVKVLTDYLSWIRFWKKFYSSRQDPFEEEHFLEALSNEWKINAYLDILLARKRRRDCPILYGQEEGGGGY